MQLPVGTRALKDRRKHWAQRRRLRGTRHCACAGGTVALRAGPSVSRSPRGSQFDSMVGSSYTGAELPYWSTTTTSSSCSEIRKMRDTAGLSMRTWAKRGTLFHLSW